MNKKSVLITVVGLLSSFSVFAMGKPAPLPQPTDSWDTIRQEVAANGSLSISQTDYASSFGGLGFFNACTDGTNFRSLTPLKVCTAGHYIHQGGGQESGGGDVYVCDTYGTQDVVLSINQTVQTCVAWVHQGGGGQESGGGDDVCTTYQSSTITLPSAPVFSVTQTLHSGGGQESGGNDMTGVLFTKPYTIPACN